MVELVDMFVGFMGWLAAGEMMVTGFTRTGIWIRVLGVVRGVVAALRRFAELGSRIMLSKS